MSGKAGLNVTTNGILLDSLSVDVMRYPGPRGFLLFFIGKFCDANRFLIFFYWHASIKKASGTRVSFTEVFTF